MTRSIRDDCDCYTSGEADSGRRIAAPARSERSFGNCLSAAVSDPEVNVKQGRRPDQRQPVWMLVG